MNYEELLLELIQKNEDLFVVTAENRAAIRNLPEKISERFIDTGITEQTMIGLSAGLALRGRKPIAHALASFLTMRAFEFIRTDVGIPSLPVKLVGGVPGFLSEANGPTHQAIEDISLMRTIPNMQVFAPADEDDMIKSLPKIITNDHPAYIRFNNQKALVNHSEFEFGKAEIFGEGNDLLILTYGMLFNQTFKAKEMLEANGIKTKLLNLRSLKPIDEKIIIDSIKSADAIAIVEDHFITGGLFSIVAEILLKNQMTANVLPIALMNKWFKPALLNDVLEYEGFRSVDIFKKILIHLEKSSNVNFEQKLQQMFS